VTKQINTILEKFFSTEQRLLSELTLRTKKKMFLTGFAQWTLLLWKSGGLDFRFFSTNIRVISNLPCWVDKSLCFCCWRLYFGILLLSVE